MKPSLSYPLFFLCGAASSLFGSSASATVGQSVSFSVTAAGTTPFSFSWRKGGVAIPGATSNPFVIPSAVLADAGNYTAVVLNAAGSTTSDVGTLTVTAAAPTPAYALDFSKQYAEAGITANYDPPVGQWQTGFVIVPIKKSRDTGNHFNDATGIYTVGVSEAGVYEIRMTLRAVDNPPSNVSVGLTSGTTNLDLQTGWGVTPPPSNNFIHWGLEHVNTRTLTDGAQIRCNVFVAAPITIQSFDVVIRRIL